MNTFFSPIEIWSYLLPAWEILGYSTLSSLDETTFGPIPDGEF